MSRTSFTQELIDAAGPFRINNRTRDGLSGALLSICGRPFQGKTSGAWIRPGITPLLCFRTAGGTYPRRPLCAAARIKLGEGMRIRDPNLGKLAAIAPAPATAAAGR